MADPLVSEWHCRDLGKVHVGQRCVEINLKLKLLMQFQIIKCLIKKRITALQLNTI